MSVLILWANAADGGTALNYENQHVYFSGNGPDSQPLPLGAAVASATTADTCDQFTTTAVTTAANTCDKFTATAVIAAADTCDKFTALIPQ